MKLRLVAVPGKDVEIGKSYVLGAIPKRAALQPGEIPNPAAPKIDMQMIPCRLEVVTEDEDGNEQVERVTIDMPSPIVVPGASGRG